MPDDLCSLRLTRRYSVGPDEVWAALSESESLARWLAAPRVIELRRGGRFELELPDGGRIEGRVLEIEPGRLLVVDWHFADEEPSIVRFELAPDGQGTMLVLEHTRIEEPSGMIYIARWSETLERFGEAVAR